MSEEYNVRPIPLSERLPQPEDCLEIKTSAHIMHFCWLCYPMMHYGEERLIWDWKMTPMANERGWERWTHWLPASTKYLPARVEG